jgi:tetratricopeptide (TPR) repeat protein
LAGGLAFFWYVRGYARESIGWLEQALAQQEHASKPVVAKALMYLGNVLNTGENRNLDRITNLLEKSLSLYQELEDNSGTAWVLNSLGLVAAEQKDYIKAKQLLSQSLSLRYQIGDPWGIAHTLQNFPSLALQENNPVASKQLAEETIALFTQAGDQRGAARTLADLAELERVRGNPSQAIVLLKQSLPQLVLFKDKWSIASVLEDLAALEIMQENFQRAVRLYAVADSLREIIGMPYRSGNDERVKDEQNLAIARMKLDEVTFAEAWSEGRIMTMEQAIPYALEERVG